MSSQVLFDACLEAVGYDDAAIQLYLVIRGVRRGAIIHLLPGELTAAFKRLRLDRDTRERLESLNAIGDAFDRLALFAEAHGLLAIRRDPHTVFIQPATRAATALRRVLRLPGDFISFTAADYDLFTAVGAFLEFPKLTPDAFAALESGQARGRGLLTLREIQAVCSGGQRPRKPLMFYAYATDKGVAFSKRKDWAEALTGLRLSDGARITGIDIVERPY